MPTGKEKKQQIFRCQVAGEKVELSPEDLDEFLRAFSEIEARYGEPRGEDLFATVAYEGWC